MYEMHDFLESDIAQGGGIATASISFALKINEYFGIYDFHDFTQDVLSLGGGIFLFYKIVTIRLDYKLKKRMLKEDQKENLCDNCKNNGIDEEL